MPISVVESFFPSWTKLLAVAVFATIPLIAVWFRSGSTHVIWSRLWRLANGKGNKAQSELQKILTERDDLMKFRVQTGVKARTTKLALAVQTWCKENDEEIGDVGSCGRYFDTEKAELKMPPSWKLQIPLYLVLIGLLVINLFLVGGFLTPRLWSIVPSDSRTWVTLGENDARTFWTHHLFSIDDCSKSEASSIAKQAEIPEVDVQIICGWLKNSAYKQDFSKQMHAQRTSAVFLLGIFLLPSYLLYTLFASGVTALAMHQRQEARSKKQSASIADRRACLHDRIRAEKGRKEGPQEA